MPGRARWPEYSPAAGSPDRLLGQGHIRARIIVPVVSLLALVPVLALAIGTTSVLLAVPLLVVGAFLLGAPNPPMDAARLDIMPPSCGAGPRACARYCAPSVRRAPHCCSATSQAHLANMVETQVGEFAELDGGTPAIRSAGSELVRDHTALDSKLIQVAGALKLQLPQSLTVQQTEVGDRLSKELGYTFDHDFTASMMTAHQALIAATRYEITHGSSAEVVNLAGQTLPLLEKHLKMMQSLAPTG